MNARRKRVPVRRLGALLFAVAAAAALLWLAVSTMAAWQMSEAEQTVALAIGVPVLLLLVYGIWKESGRDA